MRKAVSPSCTKWSSCRACPSLTQPGSVLSRQHLGHLDRAHRSPQTGSTPIDVASAAELTPIVRPSCRCTLHLGISGGQRRRNLSTSSPPSNSARQVLSKITCMLTINNRMAIKLTSQYYFPTFSSEPQSRVPLVMEIMIFILQSHLHYVMYFLVQ